MCKIKRKYMKVNKKDSIIRLLPLIFIFILLLMIKICTPKINGKYLIGTTKRETLELFEEMKGKVEAKETVSIGLDIQLGVDEVYFKEGERVKKGDIIIKFSDYKGREVEEKLNEKKQELAVKNSQLRYLKQQEKEGMDVKEGREKLSGEIKLLQAEVEKFNNEAVLLQRFIMSPVDGYVVKLNVVKGGTSSLNIPVVILAKASHMKIVSEPVPFEKLEYVNPGNKGIVNDLNNSENKFDVILYKIGDTGVKGLKTLEFLAFPVRDMQLNQILNVKLIYQKRENVITVPVRGVVRKKDRGNRGKYVIYLIDKDNRITEREVQVGIDNGEKMEISGKEIKEGMEIVINPDEKIKDNVIVSRRDLFSEKKIRQDRLIKLEKENEKKIQEIEKNEIEIINLKRGENQH